jgi:arabinan endo-1,5-alpha-L-arabinosidase
MSFTVDARAEGDGFEIDVSADGRSKSYAVPTATQQDFSAFFRDLSHDFGSRVPHVFAEPLEHPAASMHWRPLLTENISPRILVGYGDPAVFKDGEDYWLVATSNDAPDAFPILHSRDLLHWECQGFVFPEGSEPGWAAKGRNMADFWAPEMHRVGEQYWIAFTARQATNALAIGLARAPAPLGPWIDNGAPLVTGKPVNTTGLGYDADMSQMSG